MTDRWQQLEKICQSALEVEESKRRAFLEDACGGDAELRREVESLLRYDKGGDRFIEEPALEMAAKMVAQEKPESLVGQKLGSYQIVSVLGAGGMGVVYQARDTRLKRSVAIKVLPNDRLSDPERKRRFIQEARAASALNHPNIITIHDIGNESGIDFIVMEYVTGKTLDERIPRKGMQLNEALKLAVQMADALSKAHSAGIIHRDLKPSNVMVTDEGLVKVLDFGLAKLTEVEGHQGGTRTTQPQTETGTIIGTVSYMSPEQAEGKKVDARSDTFSFGAVLYEMVTGQKAFEGDSKISTLAAIVKQEPKPVSQRVPGIPQDLEKIVNRCLRKDPERRFQHMADIKVTLHELKEESDSGTLAEKTPAVRWTRPVLVCVGAALVVVAITTAAWLFRGTASKPGGVPEVIPLTSYTGTEQNPNFSPDGNQVAFSWNGEKQDNFDIYVKLIGSPTPLRLTSNPAKDVSPAFSPDGRSIGFVRVSNEHATFMLIPAIGGPERPIAEIPAPNPHVPGGPAFAWFPDGKWVVTGGLALLSTESGEIRSLTYSPTQSISDYSPSVSPDGRTLAFSRLASLGTAEIYILNLTEDFKPREEPRRLTSLKHVSSSPVWTPNGQEIIFSSGALGSPFSLWKVPASGAREPEPLPFTSEGAYSPAVSRSGNRLAYERSVSDDNIWRLSLSGPGVASGPPARFIASTRDDGNARYSPDGKRIAFGSTRNGVYGLWVSDADGSNAMELFSRAGAASGDPSWSPDGQRIAFDSSAEGHTDVYVIQARGGKPIRLTTDPADDDDPNWSGDGNWIYFASNRTGRPEVWKVSSAGGKAVQVTRNGGGRALESPDRKSLYYTKGHIPTPSGLWNMAVNGGHESQVLPSVFINVFSLVNDGIYFIPEPGPDRKCSIRFLSFATGKLRTVAPISESPWEGLSVSPDGRFLLFCQTDQGGGDLMLVENFR
jgi:serine/threonine protein kinase/Tol biopolymer transport system component